MIVCDICQLELRNRHGWLIHYARKHRGRKGVNRRHDLQPAVIQPRHLVISNPMVKHGLSEIFNVIRKEVSLESYHEAMSALERDGRPTMPKDEAIKLLKKAVLKD